MTESSVASIFKTLVKVPIVIVVSYLILNIFAFALSYFRILGASYSLQQIIMENNYLPEQEAASFARYLKSLETDFLTNVSAVVYTDIDPSMSYTGRDDAGALLKSTTYSGVIGNNSRTQYGSTAAVGIVSNFKALFPWRYDQMFQNSDAKKNYSGGGVEGWKVDNNIDSMNFRSDEDLHKNRLFSTARIDIIHPVIGLQYYSDLE